MLFCASKGRSSDALAQAFAAMKLQNDDGDGSEQASRPKQPASAAAGADPDAQASKRELGTLLSAMRKLREALVATNRADAFAQRAYVFVVRAAILTATYENYQPALLRLLYAIHPRTPLSRSELQEFVGYQVLDLACRLGRYGEAFAVRRRWGAGCVDARVEGILRALVRDEWIAFWRWRDALDGYQRALVGWAEEEVRVHALKCLGQTYFTVEKGYVEKCGGRNWTDLKTLNRVGWELEGDKVTIRRPKKK